MSDIKDKTRDLSLYIASFLEANNCTLCIDTAESGELEVYIWRPCGFGAEARYILVADFPHGKAEITAEQLKQRHENKP